MKNRKYGMLFFILAGTAGLMNSCVKEQDYSAITFRNYLGYEISNAENLLDEKVEGVLEGEYKEGSKQAYQSVVDASRTVYTNSGANQKAIDAAYENLLKAGEDFYDHMNPFISAFRDLITYAEFIVASTEENGTEGTVIPGSKEIFQHEIDAARSILNSTELVQRMIDTETPLLLNALYAFDGKIVGKGRVFLENQGFESPGYATVNFDEVPGWNLFGKLETWASRAEVYKGGSAMLPPEAVPEGEFVVRLGSYTQGIYQLLQERVHPGVTYTLDLKASLLSNNPDAFGRKYKVIVLSRVINFEKEAGDYKFIRVISEKYDTLGLNATGFIGLQQFFTIGASSEFTGSRIAVDLMVRHTFDQSNPIWAECYVALDDIVMYRK